MEKLNLKYTVIVEGKYDKIKLSNIISSPIIEIGGFALLNNEKKKNYIKTLAKSSKLIILTDSDKAGGFIRSRLKGIVSRDRLINLYIPKISGKEKRKNAPSAENLLGVEGMEGEVLRKLLAPYEEENSVEKVTSSHFWDAGLSGKSDSAEKRKELSKAYDLPEDLTTKSLLDAINSSGGLDRFLQTTEKLWGKKEKSDMKTEKTVSFYTLGCRVNQYETRGIAEQLFKNGFKIVPFGEQSDFAFINTCAVTAESERKSLVAIKKGANASKHAIVAGCYSEHKPEKVKSIKGVSFVVGCKEKERCVGAIKALAGMGNEFVPLSICNAPPKAFPFISACRAYVKIQDGCNGNCTYCLIHKLRGKSTKRDIGDVLSEAERLASAGYKEIILTGIESSAFGTKALTELIRKIGDIPQIKRIRLGSLDPNVLTDEFISCIKETESFMPHLHLSVQSPNSRILRLMKRPYNGEKLRQRIEALRDAIPEIMLSADIITSFPTETKEEFEETLEFVKKYNLLHVHAFSFSPRPGTEAYGMDGKIPKDEAKERNLRLIEVSKEIKENILSKKLGIPTEILVESFDGEYFKGHTKDFAEALIIPEGCKKGFEYAEGDIVMVTPVSVENGCIICKKDKK